MAINNATLYTFSLKRYPDVVEVNLLLTDDLLDDL